MADFTRKCTGEPGTGFKNLSKVWSSRDFVVVLTSCIEQHFFLNNTTPGLESHTCNLSIQAEAGVRRKSSWPTWAEE